MSKQRGASRFFRIGLEADRDDVAATAYGTAAQGYTDAAVSGATKDMRFFQVSEGNFSIGAQPLVEEQPVLRGQIGVHHREKTGTTVSGDVGVLAHPEEVRYFLDAGLYRDATQELAPHTIQEFYPGIDASEKGASYIGCKCSQLAGAWGSGTNRVSLTTTWTGQQEVAYTGTLPDVAGTFTKPKNGYVFSTSALVDFGKVSSGIALPLAVFTDVSFQVANGLAEGPRAFNPVAALRGAITDLTAGQERVSGSFTLQWNTINVLTWLRDFEDLLLRSVFIHPTSNNSLVVSGVETAGSAVEIALDSDPAGIVAVGDVVAFQHGAASTTTNYTTGKVTAINSTANDITVDVLDANLAVGDVVWSEALEIRLNTINMTNLTKSGGPDDAVITLQGNFEGKSDSTGDQLSYSAPGTGLAFS